MIRGFVTGLVWGGVVAGAGLAVMSQVAPLPDATKASTTAAAPAQPESPSIEDAAPGVLSEPVSPPQDTAVLDSATDAAQQADLSEAAPDLPAEAALVPDLLAPAKPEDPGLADLADSGSDVPAVPALKTASPPALETMPVADASPPPAPETVPKPATDAEPRDETATPPPTAPDAGGDTAATKTPDAAAPMPEADTMPRLIVPDGKPLITQPESTPDAPALPRIGDPEPPVVDIPTVVTPIELFARPFDNPDAKPLFAIMLVDDGAAETDRETLAALPFPVTFVLDPMMPGAAEATAIYRKAGQEVVMSTAAVPANSEPSGFEQSYQALDMAMPEAVAVLGVAGLEADGQDLAAATIPIISAQGRGVVTIDRGLNAVDQVARREGVPQATVFRLLDASDETVPVIRRYLDRAAFRAMQEGSVVVLGRARAETVAAILQWTVEGRGASVALAPISAVLKQVR